MAKKLHVDNQKFYFSTAHNNLKFIPFLINKENTDISVFKGGFFLKRLFIHLMFSSLSGMAGRKIF